MATIQISDLAGGSVQAQLDHVFDRVIANLLDPAVQPDCKHRLTIQIDFEASNNRDLIFGEVKIKSPVTHGLESIDIEFEVSPSGLTEVGYSKQVALL